MAAGYASTSSWTGWRISLSLGENGITLHLAVDGIAAPMVLLTGIVILAGVFISWNIDYRNKDYFILLFALVAGVFGVFVSQDLFFLFFFYEVAVLPMYLLIAVWGASSNFGTFVRTKEYGAMKLVLYLVAGSVLIFIAIFATFTEAGQGTFDLPVLGEATYGETFQKTFFPFYMIGFGSPGRPLALPHLVARRPRGRPHGGLHAARRCPYEAGGVRHPPGRDRSVP